MQRATIRSAFALNYILSLFFFLFIIFWAINSTNIMIIIYFFWDKRNCHIGFFLWICVGPIVNCTIRSSAYLTDGHFRVKGASWNDPTRFGVHVPVQRVRAHTHINLIFHYLKLISLFKKKKDKNKRTPMNTFKVN